MNRRLAVLLIVAGVLLQVSMVVNVAIYGLELRFPPCIGESNYPTIADGQKVLFAKPWRKLKIGDMVMVKWAGGFMVKRIHTIRPKDGALWLWGDNRNPGASFDSELLGYIDRRAVVGLCLMRLPFYGPTAAEQEGKPTRKANYKPLEPEIVTTDYEEVAEKLKDCYLSQYAFKIPDIFMGKVRSKGFRADLPAGTKYVSVCWVGEGGAVVVFGHSKMTMVPTKKALAQFCTVPPGVTSARVEWIGGDPVRVRFKYYREFAR